MNAKTSASFAKFTDIDNNPHVYHNTFEVGKTTGPDRLIIAPASGQIDLICMLLEALPGPFGFLYILVIPRGGSHAGRYQLKDSITLDGIKNLLQEYRDFFEGDGRHTLFIASHTDEAMLVYDRHNVIYAYGNLDRVQAQLVKLGYQNELVRFPVPHVHHYHAELDGDEHRLLSDREWMTFPLQESDEE